MGLGRRERSVRAGSVGPKSVGPPGVEGKVGDVWVWRDLGCGRCGGQKCGGV